MSLGGWHRDCPERGNIFDHHSVVYEYAGGRCFQLLPNRRVSGDVSTL
jgi:hypothetical protein